MGITEFIAAPFYLLLIIAVGFIVRPRVSDRNTRRYFIPGLMVKLGGALALGLIYQFYYQGGDTLNYYYYLGSVPIWQAFLDSPAIALKLIFVAGSEYDPSTFEYASRIYSYGDLPTYFVVRVAGLFSLFTLNSYYAISLLFAGFSFAGAWALYYAFYRIVPKRHLLIALAVLFVPSVFFWGSGLLKDTITFGTIGWLIFSFFEFFIHQKRKLIYPIIMICAAYILYLVKIYIALCLIPALILFLFFRFLKTIRNVVIRILAAPLVISGALVSGYYAVLKIGEDNSKYSIDRFIETAQVSAEWLYYISESQGGSGYTLGDIDYSPTGIAAKFIPAVWVSLYRPYIWEANNLVMLISAVESFIFLVLTIWVVFKAGLITFIRESLKSPLVLCLLIFSISFAFAIGFSTFNFGSLVRYKIPMIPMFLFALILIWEKSRSNYKLSV